MTVITGLAASHPVKIVSFGESGPDTATAPFRSAELAETNMQKMLATVSGAAAAFPRRAHGIRAAEHGTSRTAHRLRRAEPVRAAGIGYRQRRLSPGRARRPGRRPAAGRSPARGRRR